MPVAGASSKSSRAKGIAERELGEGHAGVAVFMSRLPRTLAREAEFWLSSERDYVGRVRGEAEPMVGAKGR